MRLASEEPSCSSARGHRSQPHCSSVYTLFFCGAYKEQQELPVSKHDGSIVGGQRSIGCSLDLSTSDESETARMKPDSCVLSTSSRAIDGATQLHRALFLRKLQRGRVPNSRRSFR